MIVGDLALSDSEKGIVLAILARHLAPGHRVYVFGSRSRRETVKPWADLDLLIEGGAPLPLTTLAALGTAFDDSPLPWKVDVVDRAMATDEFGAAVARDKVLLFES